MGRRSDRGNIPYAATRAKMRRVQLLPDDAYARMVMMEIPDISRTLGEGVYRKEMETLATRFRGVDLLEQATAANLARTCREVLGFCRGGLREQVASYLRRWDLWNVKTLLRGKFSGAPAEEVRANLVPAGELSAARMEEMLAAPSLAELVQGLSGTPYHEALARGLAESGDAPKDLAPLENRLDRAYYEGLLAGRPSTRADALFRDFVRLEVDVVNLRTLLRLKADGQPADKVIELLLPGGKHLKPPLLRSLAEAPAAEIPGLLRGTPLAPALAPLEQDPGATSRALRALEKWHLSRARAFAHAYPLSALPVLDLLLRKKNEVDNLRIIARGKEAGMGEEEIREQLVM